MPPTLFQRLADRLRDARTGDGFGPRPGLPPEPEPTALAALALDDEGAGGWLADNQREDGGLAVVAGAVVNDSATALAALALPPGEARERALEHLLIYRAQTVPSDEIAPHDPDLRGWGWTPDTFGWVEPTARAVLALRILRPTAREAIDEGIALLADRECSGGGWNYGNSFVFGVALDPFAQTTAAALIALQGDASSDLAGRGLSILRGLWRTEAGALTLAMTVAALRLFGDPDAEAAEEALARDFGATGLLDDVVAIAWAAVATGPGLGRLRVPEA